MLTAGGSGCSASWSEHTSSSIIILCCLQYYLCMCQSVTGWPTFHLLSDECGGTSTCKLSTHAVCKYIKHTVSGLSLYMYPLCPLLCDSSLLANTSSCLHGFTSTCSYLCLTVKPTSSPLDLLLIADRYI